MAEKILETEIIREQGMIYFCKEVNGKICVFKAKAGRPRKQPKPKKTSVIPPTSGSIGDPYE